MSWECKYLRETFCDKRKKECCPGDAGCVLYGKYVFPLRDDTEGKAPKKASKKDFSSNKAKNSD
ncbi:MAG: hypothetical protein J6U20_13955 [Fibrobacter sp.]|nr:hypothetical protein [Fibrobacter sp.]